MSDILHLILVYTVCLGISVPIFRVITVKDFIMKMHVVAVNIRALLYSLLITRAMVYVQSDQELTE